MLNRSLLPFLLLQLVDSRSQLHSQLSSKKSSSSSKAQAQGIIDASVGATTQLEDSSSLEECACDCCLTEQSHTSSFASGLQCAASFMFAGAASEDVHLVPKFCKRNNGMCLTTAVSESAESSKESDYAKFCVDNCAPADFEKGQMNLQCLPRDEEGAEKVKVMSKAGNKKEGLAKSPLLGLSLKSSEILENHMSKAERAELERDQELLLRFDDSVLMQGGAGTGRGNKRLKNMFKADSEVVTEEEAKSQMKRAFEYAKQAGHAAATARETYEKVMSYGTKEGHLIASSALSELKHAARVQATEAKHLHDTKIQKANQLKQAVQNRAEEIFENKRLEAQTLADKLAKAEYEYEKAATSRRHAVKQWDAQTLTDRAAGLDSDAIAKDVLQSELLSDQAKSFAKQAKEIGGRTDQAQKVADYYKSHKATDAEFLGREAMVKEMN